MSSTSASQDKLVVEFRRRVPGAINHDNVVDVVRTGMEVVGMQRAMRGSEKKQWVLEHTAKLIEEQDEKDVDKPGLLFVLEHIVPPMIDVIASAANGKVNVKAVSKLSLSCCLCLSSRLETQ